MEKPSVEHISDNSDHAPSNEKIGVEEGALETLPRSQLPPDPDAHLSEAERAAIVSPIGLPTAYTPLLCR